MEVTEAQPFFIALVWDCDVSVQSSIAIPISMDGAMVEFKKENEKKEQWHPSQRSTKRKRGEVWMMTFTAYVLVCEFLSPLFFFLGGGGGGWGLNL